ncbi:recombinase family protein [Candidatus Pacearchaeota archaeon]|nr:recombinase family protein [Candidatus Pacearchaeota archaeon]
MRHIFSNTLAFIKIITNQTYLGKVKFGGQLHQGTHQQLISSTLFNHVQNKMEKLGIGKK